MKVENTFDEVVFNAAHGYEPSQKDLDRIVVPPGVDPDDFYALLRATVSHILGAKGEGAQQEARRIASDAADRYLTAFENQPKPRSIHDIEPTSGEQINFPELIKTIGRR